MKVSVAELLTYSVHAMPMVGQLAAQTNLLQFLVNSLELHNYTKTASIVRGKHGLSASIELKVCFILWVLI